MQDPTAVPTARTGGDAMVIDVIDYAWLHGSKRPGVCLTTVGNDGTIITTWRYASSIIVEVPS